MCAIKLKEYGIAAEIFNDLPEPTKNAPLSRLLMFKVALRTSDEDLGEWDLCEHCFNSADRDSHELPHGNITASRE